LRGNDGILVSLNDLLAELFQLGLQRQPFRLDGFETYAHSSLVAQRRGNLLTVCSVIEGLGCKLALDAAFFGGQIRHFPFEPSDPVHERFLPLRGLLARGSFGPLLIAPLAGHVGDGNFHLVFLLDRDDPKEMAEAERLNDRLVMRALALGGTSTGEHGVGMEKKAYIRLLFNDADLAAMARVRRAFDPDNRFNPAKLFPTPASCGEVRLEPAQIPAGLWK